MRTVSVGERHAQIFALRVAGQSPMLTVAKFTEETNFRNRRKSEIERFWMMEL